MSQCKGEISRSEIIRKPILISDSKAHKLRNNFFKNPAYPLITFPFDVWADSTTRKCIDVLETQLDDAVRKHSNVLIYVWTGTCDITTKRPNKELVVRRPHSKHTVNKNSSSNSTEGPLI